jgi:hypothetical protein
MKTFKFFHENNHYGYSLPIATRVSGRTITNELVPVRLMNPPGSPLHMLRNSFYGAMGLRDIAVIASSIQNFINWRNETFDISSICIITSGDFTYTDENNLTTRYTAITTINDCRGYTFDDYITTDRIEDILLSGYDDTINHIRQIIVEVNLHTRDNETI